ncbi:helix-turn-helix domain-containing protein [Amycolatopsis sp. NPDC059021]|uniref:helix-turn-helix domain-containing protein n=1 Tax=Amycolatopsis sp. NPDC059021 TaxID=3346704 RepID=UPI00366F05A8
MFEPESVEARQISLAEALRTLRRASGLSGERLADRTGISQSKISKIETGKLRPSITDVEQIVHALGVDRGYAHELLTLAQLGTVQYESDRDKSKLGWGKVQDQLAAIERSAAEIRFLLPTMITGLLQTPEYASVAVNHPVGRQTPEAVQREIVARKLARQRILYDTGKRFRFLFAEAALRWRLLPAPAMAIQLDKVVSFAALSSVSVQVIPLSVTMADAPLEVFVAYDDRLVRIETSTCVLALRDPWDIAFYRAQFDHFSSSALGGEEAREFISGIADEFRMADG